MRLSVATRIFLGFAVVIVAFGATNAYTVYRMGELRRAVTVMWKEVIPIQNDLRALSTQVRSVEELFTWKRPDANRLIQQVLPTLEPFEGVRSVRAAATALAQLAADDSLVAADRVALREAAARLEGFIRGDALIRAVDADGLDALVADAEARSSGGFYRWLVRRTLNKANVGELGRTAVESRAIARALRRLHRELSDVGRALGDTIRSIDQRADAEERSTTLTIVAVAGLSLLLSIGMLIMSQYTLKPIRELREGARRIAAGNYDELVEVSSSDEIGALADEFNRMASALAAREAEVQRQREELLRAERLAVIGKLAAQITHEVRNPLSSIGLNAELLEEELSELDDDAGEEALASLRAIIDEVQRLKSITEEYLHFARLPRPDLANVDVGALLGQFLSFLTREVSEAGVTLEARGVVPAMEGGPPPIRADADQLRQALLNIARNAIDVLRTEPSPRRLEVTLEPGASGGVKIRIADNGPGIDDALRERIFDPFVTGKPHGTGLGLALTREIVVEHGGDVIAESPIAGDRGTAFVITLRADAASHKAPRLGGASR